MIDFLATLYHIKNHLHLAMARYSMRYISSHALNGTKQTKMWSQNDVKYFLDITYYLKDHLHLAMARYLKEVHFAQCSESYSFVLHADHFCPREYNEPYNNIVYPPVDANTSIIPATRQWLTHWGRDKMAAISQTTLSNSFSWVKMYEFRFQFHWSLFLRVQLTIFQHWFR